jgi:hypothetical protein
MGQCHFHGKPNFPNIHQNYLLILIYWCRPKWLECLHVNLDSSISAKTKCRFQRAVWSENSQHKLDKFFPPAKLGKEFCTEKTDLPENSNCGLEKKNCNLSRNELVINAKILKS